MGAHRAGRIARALRFARAIGGGLTHGRVFPACLFACVSPTTLFAIPTLPFAILALPFVIPAQAGTQSWGRTGFPPARE